MTNILERLDTVTDHLERAALVQNHSVHIIKQVCAINAKEVQAIHADVVKLVEALREIETVCTFPETDDFGWLRQEIKGILLKVIPPIKVVPTQGKTKGD